MRYLGDIAQLLIALATVFNAWQAWRGRQIGAANTGKIDDVHGLMNSRLSELIKKTELASKAEGVEQGRNEPR